MRWKQCQAQDSPFNKILISSRIESLPSDASRCSAYTSGWSTRSQHSILAGTASKRETRVICQRPHSLHQSERSHYITSGSLADGVHHDVTPRLWAGLVGADPLDTGA